MHRRAFLTTYATAGLAAPAISASALPAYRTLRVSLLGRALIEYAPTAEEWPGRRAIAARLSRADAVFTNLETVIKGPNAGTPTRELLTLHVDEPEVLDTPKSVHVGLLATASNHAFDLGLGGILDTVTAIRRAGLASAGSGETLSVASAPAQTGSRRRTTALVAFATGKVRPGGGATTDRAGVNELRRDASGQPNAEDLSRMLDAIVAAGASADVVLAFQPNHDWEPVQADVPGWQRPRPPLYRGRRLGLRRPRRPFDSRDQISSRCADLLRPGQLHLPDREGRRRLWARILGGRHRRTNLHESL